MFLHKVVGFNQYSLNTKTLTITCHNVERGSTFDVKPTEDYGFWETLMKNHFPEA